MDKNFLKQVILDQNTIKLPKNMVSRYQHDTLMALRETSQILIIKGIRRCGKSVMLQQLRTENTENHYYVNFDDDRLMAFQLEDFQMLLELFIELYGVEKTFYFDEIQNIEGWERFVRRLHDQGNKIYITGSNATMFSQELGTHLTGRYIPIELYPFSFKEFIHYTHRESFLSRSLTSYDKAQLKGIFSEFLVSGGFPEYVETKQEYYLHSLYESIIYRDIVARYKISEKSIRWLVLYLASNIGKEISYNALRKMLNLASATTVSDYCSYTENSFLTFLINRYSDSLKKQIHYAKKIYFIDQALAKTVGFRISEDYGRILENIIFIELKRRGKEIYFHKEKKECDFLIKEKTRIVNAIQVSAHLNQEKTKSREIAGLLEALEIYDLKEGHILTEDVSHTETRVFNQKKYTIHTVPIWSWLLS